MITYRLFKPEDVNDVAKVIAKTLRISNRKDYSHEYIEADIKSMNAQFFIDKAKQTHFYVFCDADRSIGTGAIGSYWGSTTEYSLFDIFILPNFQHQGIGRLIIETLEKDSYFLKATRVEIPASITALPFYQHMGYMFKDGQHKPDKEQLYRLEKFPRAE
ncbi:GNAT family N-acetyltransferase [Pediococcus ethanolidurans]|uniref:Ribosomal protein S18 acetylase RimI n=1 Tax=Pediococcus ethanolidurans TaxID=319653 RepID=A0A1H9N5S7_9LACO|nr:GNAT family N-acetyltransferase [Pediococcus ethanolidurans]GEN94617.1 N-acetyltransferase [Pediococcus ethanolidurans]SER31029.1 Ribosomal protein S18 acetylase RimI [Pediococcus ethanolidurans]